MDVRFEIQDLFEKLRPNAKIYDNLQDAAEALNEMVVKYAKPSGTAENAGDVSDGTSEKSDYEPEEQPEPMDDEQEEEERPEELEVRYHISILIS